MQCVHCCCSDVLCLCSVFTVVGDALCLCRVCSLWFVMSCVCMECVHCGC